MFPLAFLIIGCVTFTILGFVILASVPFFRVTFLNLSVFPLGAILRQSLSYLCTEGYFRGINWVTGLSIEFSQSSRRAVRLLVC
jgi:hypothetical protein